MFGDINKAEIMGNITHDLELRHTGSGTAVLSFRVATNRRYQQEGEWKEDVEFHNVVIWAQRAESFVQRAQKGTRVYVEGRLQTSSWEDGNGVKQYRTEIVAQRVILIDRYEKGEGFKGDAPGGKVADSSTTKEQPAQSKAEAPTKEKQKDAKSGSSQAASDEEQIDPDDLPF